MKEIGGYFGIEQGTGRSEFYPSLIKLNLGRNALLYVLRAKKIHKIYLPYYLCDSVLLICKKENIEPEFYQIDSNFLPIFDKTLKNDEVLYVVNYFGQINNRFVKKLSNRYKNIILDNVQSFFQKPLNHIDTITIKEIRNNLQKNREKI